MTRYERAIYPIWSSSDGGKTWSYEYLFHSRVDGYIWSQNSRMKIVNGRPVLYTLTTTNSPTQIEYITKYENGTWTDFETNWHSDSMAMSENGNLFYKTYITESNTYHLATIYNNNIIISGEEYPPSEYSYSQGPICVHYNENKNLYCMIIADMNIYTFDGSTFSHIGNSPIVDEAAWQAAINDTHVATVPWVGGIGRLYLYDIEQNYWYYIDYCDEFVGLTKDYLFAPEWYQSYDHHQLQIKYLKLSDLPIGRQLTAEERAEFWKTYSVPYGVENEGYYYPENFDENIGNSEQTIRVVTNQSYTSKNTNTMEFLAARVNGDSGWASDNTGGPATAMWVQYTPPDAANEFGSCSCGPITTTAYKTSNKYGRR